MWSEIMQDSQRVDFNALLSEVSQPEPLSSFLVVWFWPALMSYRVLYLNRWRTGDPISLSLVFWPSSSLVSSHPSGILCLTLPAPTRRTRQWVWALFKIFFCVFLRPIPTSPILRPTSPFLGKEVTPPPPISPISSSPSPSTWPLPPFCKGCLSWWPPNGAAGGASSKSAEGLHTRVFQQLAKTNFRAPKKFRERDINLKPRHYLPLNDMCKVELFGRKERRLKYCWGVGVLGSQHGGGGGGIAVTTAERCMKGGEGVELVRALQFVFASNLDFLPTPSTFHKNHLEQLNSKCVFFMMISSPKW